MREEFLFLNQLRYSGETNMFGATPYLQEEFDISRTEARDILTEWMAWAQEDDGNVMIGVDEEDGYLGEYDDEDMTEEEEYGLALINDDDEEWE